LDNVTLLQENLDLEMNAVKLKTEIKRLKEKIDILDDRLEKYELTQHRGYCGDFRGFPVTIDITSPRRFISEGFPTKAPKEYSLDARDKLIEILDKYR